MRAATAGGAVASGGATGRRCGGARLSDDRRDVLLHRRADAWRAPLVLRCLHLRERGLLAQRVLEQLEGDRLDDELPVALAQLRAIGLLLAPAASGAGEWWASGRASRRAQPRGGCRRRGGGRGDWRGLSHSQLAQRVGRGVAPHAARRRRALVGRVDQLLQVRPLGVVPPHQLAGALGAGAIIPARAGGRGGKGVLVGSCARWAARARVGRGWGRLPGADSARSGWRRASTRAHRRPWPWPSIVFFFTPCVPIH